MASCLSVRLSVTLGYRGHIGWNSWKNNFTVDYSLYLSSLYRSQHDGSTPKGTPLILAGVGVGYGKIGSGRTQLAISPKRLKIERNL